MQRIQLSTGKILSIRATKKTRLAAGEALMDPETQEYDPARKRIRTKTPDLSGTLPYRLEALAKENAELSARVTSLEQQLAALLSRTIPGQIHDR